MNTTEKFLKKQLTFWLRWVEKSSILSEEDRYLLKPVITGIFERMLKDARELTELKEEEQRKEQEGFVN